jgi:hypothetical protein
MNTGPSHSTFSSAPKNADDKGDLKEVDAITVANNLPSEIGREEALL